MTLAAFKSAVASPIIKHSEGSKSRSCIVLKIASCLEIGAPKILEKHLTKSKALRMYSNSSWGVAYENVEFIETQVGEYLGEDDIIRYEDDFGRV